MLWQIFFSSIIILLSGCGKNHPVRLPQPKGQIQKIGDIEVTTTKMQSREFKRCFNTSCFPQNHDIVQLFVKNERTKSIILSTDNIELPLECPDVICKALYEQPYCITTSYNSGTASYVGPLLSAAILVTIAYKKHKKVSQDVKYSR